MKRNSHIQSLLLPWLEQSLDAPELRLVEEHLKGCALCRKYFDAMTEILLPPDGASPQGLVADPYLPARIRAMAESSGRQPHVVKGLVVRWAFTIMTFAVAIVFGIYMGEQLTTSTSAITEQNIITEYSESLDGGGIGDRLQSIAQSNTEVPK